MANLFFRNARLTILLVGLVLAFIVLPGSACADELALLREEVRTETSSGSSSTSGSDPHPRLKCDL